MQRGGPVEQHRMVLDHTIQNVPDLSALLFHHALRSLDGLGKSLLPELPDDERLEQLQRHLLGQPALVQLELRPDDDHGTPGVIHPFPEQVLAEASLLALEHIGE